MNYNPYAPQPAPPPAFAAGPQGPSAGPQPWSVGEALSVGWEALKAQFATLVFTYLISAVPGFVINQISSLITRQYSDPHDPFAMFQEPGFWIVSFGMAIPTTLVAAFFQGGLIKVWLASARGQTPQFGDVFTGGSSFPSILLFNVVTQLIFVFSALMLFIPAVVWGCGMVLAPYYMVDERAGFADALRKSWAATTGHKGGIFLLLIASAGVMMLGVLACCVGVIAALPVTMVAMAWVYTRLSGNLGGGGFNGPPVGGYAVPPGYGPGYGPGGYGGPQAPAGGGYGAPPGPGYGPGGGYGGPQAPPGGGYGGPPGY